MVQTIAQIGNVDRITNKQSKIHLCFFIPSKNWKKSEYTVMSQEGTWKMGDSTSTVLYTKEDEVVATRDTHREKESAGSSRFACYLYSLV